MAIMAPEAAAGAAGAAGIGEAGKASDQLEGSTVAFMLAIILIGGALGLLWLAFHNPSEWDLTGGQWPGLAGRALQWAQTKAEGPSLLGALNTSQPAAVSPDQAAINALTRLEGNPILGAPLPPTEQKSLAQKLISTFKQLIGGGIL